ncbi:MerR HTH family regulatory protein [Rhodovulum sp. ES.010]|uniref:MerR family transcriptional regulator n=1 Tax=Rhodovulum sp. ES.010 TaxID=1882821 RepID=UPI00092C1A4C|nr:MerR family transcriptional regulator [Rhodovulum sp. ES.010]SIO14399.1 MerR HTH family regulatory protein [Rhodovulum sp. ES.010]
MEKSPEAFRTISEVATWLDTPAHVLRFWESRFTQIKPVKRAGGRRYYRPSDMMLLGGIKKLLHEDGLTIRGVQKILREEGVKFVADLSPPIEDGGAVVIEGRADRGDGAPPAALAEEDTPEAPMQEDAQAEVEESNVVTFGGGVTPEPDEAMLPGLEFIPAQRRERQAESPEPPPAPESTPEAAEADQPAPSDAEAEPAAAGDGDSPDDTEPMPTFRRHPAPSAGEPQTEADRVDPAPTEMAPAPTPAEAAPESPSADTAPDAAFLPPEPEPEPEPETPAARGPLGTDIAREDPADTDPAFAPTEPPLRTWSRSPALRRALVADHGTAHRALDRLRALDARMKAQTPASGRDG